MSQNKEPVLAVHKVMKTYAGHTKGKARTTAVAGVSFNLHAGETVGLIGESGSGKSTLARCILLMEKLDAGQIRFQGEEIARPGITAAYRALQGQVQAVFQNPAASLNPRLRIIDSLMEPLDSLKNKTPAIVGDYRRDRQECAKRLLEMVELPVHIADHYPHQLSGGQKQRVAIARAVSSEPALIVMDEPTSGLDMITQALMVDMLKSLQQSMGFACLFISHDLGTIQRLSDSILVMQQGQIMDQFANEALFLAERHPYTKQLVDRYNS